MRSETLLTDAAARRSETGPQTPAVGSALPRAKIPGPTTARSAGPAREPGADAVRAVREREAADARGAAETAVLGAVASSMVLGALYPKDVKANIAKDHSNPHDQDARDKEAAAPGAADPISSGSETARSKAADLPQAAETHVVSKGSPDFSGNETHLQVAQHAVDPTQDGPVAATAGDSRAAASGALGGQEIHTQEIHTQEIHTSGQALLASAPEASVQQGPVVQDVGSATDIALIAHGPVEQPDTLAAVGRLPLAVGLTQFMTGPEPAGHDGGSIPAAAAASAMPLGLTTAPAAYAEAAVTSGIMDGAATAGPMNLGAVGTLVHSALGEGPTHTVETAELAAPLTQAFTDTATTLTDTVAAAAHAVGTLTGALSGSLDHDLPGLAAVTGAPTALTDTVAAAPAVGTLTGALTGSLEHDLPGLATVTGAATALTDTVAAAPAVGTLTGALTGSLEHDLPALATVTGTAAALTDTVAAAAHAVGTLTGALSGSLEHDLPALATVTGTAAALTDTVAAAAPAVGTLTEALTGSLDHDLPGLATVTGTAAALTDTVAAAPVIGTLAETLTGSLEHDLLGIASSNIMASPGGSASGLHLVDGTVSHIDDGAQAARAVAEDLLSGNANEAHQSVSALVPAIIDHAAEAAPVRNVDPISTVAQVLDAPTQTEGHAGRGLVSAVADATGLAAEAATPATGSGTLDPVVSALDTLVPAGSGLHGATALAADAAPERPSSDLDVQAAHGSVTALASALTDNAVQSVPGHDSSPVSTVAQVLDAPVHAGSHADPGPDGTVADATGLVERSAAPTEALHQLSSTVDSLISAGSGQHGTATVAAEAASDRTSSDDGQAAHQGATALATTIADHAVESAAVHGSNPVSSVAQVLDAPSHAESHAGQGLVGTVADTSGRAEESATPAATTGALAHVSSAVDALAPASSGQHGTTADAEDASSGRTSSGADGQAATASEPAAAHASVPSTADAAHDAAADSNSHGAHTSVADGVGATVGSAVGGTINLGSSQAEPSQAHGASAGPATSAAGAPGDIGHTDAGGHVADVAHVAPDSVVAPPVHVGFAGVSYTENVDSHEHGLASANGMLHGLV